jgi:predicted metal-dependent hydrolase
MKYENYLENEDTIVRLKALLVPVFPELLHVKLMKSDASYTINKQKIYLCTESDGEVYDDNMLTYVILHELAHTLCPEIGHGKQFQKIFASLLARAVNHNLFDPNIPRAENYCKMNK